MEHIFRLSALFPVQPWKLTNIQLFYYIFIISSNVNLCPKGSAVAIALGNLISKPPSQWISHFYLLTVYTLPLVTYCNCLQALEYSAAILKISFHHLDVVLSGFDISYMIRYCQLNIVVWLNYCHALILELWC